MSNLILSDRSYLGIFDNDFETVKMNRETILCNKNLRPRYFILKPIAHPFLLHKINYLNLNLWHESWNTLKYTDVPCELGTLTTVSNLSACDYIELNDILEGFLFVLLQQSHVLLFDGRPKNYTSGTPQLALSRLSHWVLRLRPLSTKIA